MERKIAGIAAFVGALAAPAAAQVTGQVSVDVDGAQTNKDSYGGAISQDGRYVGFFSYDDLMGIDGNLLFVHSDVYVRDRLTGVLEIVSVSSSEVPGDDYSYGPYFSADARFAAFTSYSTNLVPGDTNGPYPTGHDVFLRDRQLGTTERVSVSSLGTQADGMCYGATLSADARYVAFYGPATNLVPGDTNAASDVFVRDRQLGTTTRVSVDALGGQGDLDSQGGSISADGRFVAFYSSATNLVPGDANVSMDVFVHDRQTGGLVRVTVDPLGGPSNGDAYSSSISADGRFVGFASLASNLVAGDSNGFRDAFVRDLQLGTTTRVSTGAGGVQGNGDIVGAHVSAGGRYVVFQGSATNLVPGDTNGETDTFLHDRQTGVTERVSVDSYGVQGDEDSFLGTVSPDGRYVAFATRSSYVEADSNNWHDVYVRDRDYTAMTSLCDPGVGGVAACPCSNPPSGAGRGCDNSSATGGAVLSASGIAYLAQDTLVFTTSGERPSALSIVTQWTGGSASGAIFGQGVRCTSGSLERLYTKIASGGSITAPDTLAGDPPVSVRSEALGSPIPPGQSRWYFVYYRDPVVLGGCPATSTFNATQTGEVRWLP